ncbi:MAG: LysR family transcriptional regulator [Azospirillum sp.]|nr:LysR family transcriptional regulator [Azospirillum sp.]
MRFDLTDLRLFLHVVDAQSITQGAQRANLALASASARIRGMEAALGVPLFERGRRGVQPTPAGRSLIHHARAIQRQLEQMVGELGVYARGLRGQVRLLANTVALIEFLPDSLGSFLAAHPNVDVDVGERPSEVIVEAVAQGAADLGVVADTVDLGRLERRPFRLDRLVAVLPRDRPEFAGRRTLALADIIDREFVGLGPGHPLQDHILRHAARAGRNLTFRVRLGSLDAVCALVAQGVGVGIVPEATARRCRRSMSIQALRLTDSWALRNLTLCARRFDALAPYARDLVEHLGKQAPEQPTRRGRSAGTTAPSDDPTTGEGAWRPG